MLCDHNFVWLLLRKVMEEVKEKSSSEWVIFAFFVHSDFLSVPFINFKKLSIAKAFVCIGVESSVKWITLKREISFFSPFLFCITFDWFNENVDTTVSQRLLLEKRPWNHKKKKMRKKPQSEKGVFQLKSISIRIVFFLSFDWKWMVFSVVCVYCSVSENDTFESGVSSANMSLKLAIELSAPQRKTM